MSTNDEFEATDVIVNKKVFDVIRRLLRYSFIQIDWNFNNLTAVERTIIKDQEMFDEIRAVVACRWPR